MGATALSSRVLVLGGTGFLSAAVVEELQQAGYAVTVLTRGQRPVPEGVHALTGDRRDPEALTRLTEGRAFDAVVDCIGYHPSDAETLLRAFAGRTGRLVFISTDFVYGAYRVLPIEEDTPTTRPLNAYGEGKAACERRLLAAWREEGFPVTILRPPHIMGAGGHLGTGSLLGRDPMLLDRLERGAPVVLLDGGTLLIQPVHRRDVARAVTAVLGAPDAVGQAYNVAGPDCVTTRRYYQLVADTLGVEAVEALSLPSELFVRAYPDRAPFAQHRMYSVEKLARDTGFRPETTLHHCVFETVDWLQATGAAQPYRESAEDVELAALCRAFAEETGKLLAAEGRA